jgi:hypothetical protein
VSRQNQKFNAAEVSSLADEFLEAGISLRNLCRRMQEDGVDTVSVAHTATISGGLVGVKKFAREANTKIDNELDERKMKARIPQLGM